MQKLTNKTVVITGGTSGIGAACAEMFACNGASVVIAGRNEENGLDIENRIISSGGIAKFVKCDVTKESDIVKLAQDAIFLYKKIDILFNNAGVMLPSVELDRLEYSAWEETFKTNLDSCFLVIKHIRPYLLKTRGIILNTASIAGMHSYAIGRSYPYSISKAAVIQFTRMLAKNYAPEGIRVNCICPGVILTPMLHGRDPKMYEERIPMGRVGKPEDVAKAALFLVSDDSSYLTGVVLPIDGGASL
jgi:NAD(P)-dependent dehydrogenase (short-subunit alcohol dehydrogenase family)